MSHPKSASQSPEISTFQIGIVVLTLLLLAALFVDTLFKVPKEVSEMIQIVDVFCCAILLGDFAWRFHKAESKAAFMKWGWIDLLASIPNIQFLRWGRLVRILQVIRLPRGLRSTHKAFQMLLRNRRESGAVSLGLGAVLLIAFSSVAILICEQNSGGSIRTAADAIWWSISTITTVGYGDAVPATLEGRLLAMILMFAGIGLFGALSGLAASFFFGKSGTEEDAEQEILRRVIAIDARLQALESRLNSSREPAPRIDPQPLDK